jgi:hypothetical protein
MKQVSLIVTQVVTYNRLFELDDATYDEIQSKLNTLKGRELAAYEERIAETYIDFANDWLDANDTEIVAFGEQT